MNRKNITTAIVFATFFMVVSWSGPVLYAANAPSDHFIESNGFAANDTSIDANEHIICFNTTVHRSTTGTVITELYLVPTNGTPIEVLSTEERRYIQSGTYVIYRTVSLPDAVQPGEYRYRRIYTMNLAKGQIQRDFAFESEPFTITRNETNAGRPVC